LSITDFSAARASISPGLGPAFLDGSSRAETVGAGFDDVCTVCDAVQQRFAQSSVGDHLGLFGKGQVRGQDNGGLLGSFGDDLEEELRSQVGHRHIANFVYGDQIISFPSSQDTTQLQLLFSFDQFVDQRGGGGKAYSPLMPACSHAQPGKRVRLASAKSPIRIIGSARSI